MSHATRPAATTGFAPTAIVRPLHALLMIGSVVLASGCVPVPYRPSATVTEVPTVASDARSMVLTTDDQDWLRSVEDSIRKADPRVTFVDAPSYLRDAAPSGTGIELLAQHDSPAPMATADFVLSVGTPRHRSISDTGMISAVPPFIVGYEKFHQTEELSATMVDLGHNERSEAMFVLSDYSEVAAGLAYGVVVFAMPVSAVRKALVEHVVQRLHDAQPTGPVRLAVVHQDDYIPRRFAEQVAPGTSKGPGMLPHGSSTSNYFRAQWQLADVGCYERYFDDKNRTGEFGQARLDATGIELSRVASGPPTDAPAEVNPQGTSHVAYADLLPVAQVERDGWVVLRRTDGSCVHIKPKMDGAKRTGQEAGDFADTVRWQIARAAPAALVTNQ